MLCCSSGMGVGFSFSSSSCNAFRFSMFVTTRACGPRISMMVLCTGCACFVSPSLRRSSAVLYSRCKRRSLFRFFHIFGAGPTTFSSSSSSGCSASFASFFFRCCKSTLHAPRPLFLGRNATSRACTRPVSFLPNLPLKPIMASSLAPIPLVCASNPPMLCDVRNSAAALAVPAFFAAFSSRSSFCFSAAAFLIRWPNALGRRSCSSCSFSASVSSTS
mmetsp:Transcript_24575/g.46609  ORF Transcript_24575/g.46609 Transcript_24575/m.46609 type:complete len:218 (-) Transcript_24575:57-710(-)